MTGEADDKCVVQIFSTGKSDISFWYRMWEAVTAVFSICVRAGKGGAFTGLGELYTYSSDANRRAPVVLTSRTRRSGEYIPDGKFGSGGDTISGWECFFGGHIIASYDENKTGTCRWNNKLDEAL